MSRKGNGRANAVAASVFHPGKTELLYTADDDTHEAAQRAVVEYIEVFSNRQRCHAAHGSLAPLLYEHALKTHEIVCPEKC
jgi:putative transposase